MSARAVGPYQVVRELGRGGMGVVYEVVDPDLGRRAALKVILGQQATSEAMGRFWREVDALVAVRHRSVVRVYQAGDLPEGPFLLEQLVEGESLAAVVARGPLPPRRAAELALELAGALSAVHAAGVLHRDLKPSNVVVQPDGIPVLLDFGIAREQTAEALTRSGTVLGTPAYMSPEQADGRVRELDARTDVYGLGAILYELLTGRPPFSGASALEVVRKVASEEDPRWPATSVAGLDAICRRAMAKAPAERYATAAAMGDDLRRFLAGEAVTVARARSGRAARRVLALALGGGLTTGVAVAAWALRRPPTLAPEPAVAAVTTTSPAPPPRPAAERPPPHPAPPGVAWRDGRYVNEKDGSVLLFVPAGAFTMGSEEALKPDGHDAPLHRVELSAFFVGLHEVTWGQYLRFCRETQRAAPERPAWAASDEHPVVHVRWQEASDYCAWAGLRLPTEAEWEFAARGSEGRTYPWGDDPPAPERGNHPAARRGATLPVGSFPDSTSAAGCLDMDGNVREWVHDAYDPLMTFLPPKDPRVDEGPLRVARGGAWRKEKVDSLRAAFRMSYTPRRRAPDLGLRVARDATP